MAEVKLKICPYCQQPIEGSMLQHISSCHLDKLGIWMDEDPIIWAKYRRHKP